MGSRGFQESAVGGFEEAGKYGFTTSQGLPILMSREVSAPDAMSTRVVVPYDLRTLRVSSATVRRRGGLHLWARERGLFCRGVAKWKLTVVHGEFPRADAVLRTAAVSEQTVAASAAIDLVTTPAAVVASVAESAGPASSRADAAPANSARSKTVAAVPVSSEHAGGESAGGESVAGEPVVTSGGRVAERVLTLVGSVSGLVTGGMVGGLVSAIPAVALSVQGGVVAGAVMGCVVGGGTLWAVVGGALSDGAEAAAPAPAPAKAKKPSHAPVPAATPSTVAAVKASVAQFVSSVSEAAYAEPDETGNSLRHAIDSMPPMNMDVFGPVNAMINRARSITGAVN